MFSLEEGKELFFCRRRTRRRHRRRTHHARRERERKKKREREKKKSEIDGDDARRFDRALLVLETLLDVFVFEARRGVIDDDNAMRGEPSSGFERQHRREEQEEQEEQEIRIQTTKAEKTQGENRVATASASTNREGFRNDEQIRRIGS
tara:strand:- start:737 stop:1183 length:447 start_codon:yes stop_codon:yes gene_type:complete